MGVASAGGAGPGVASAGTTGSPSSARAGGPAASPGATSLPAGVNVAAFDARARKVISAWAGSPLARAWRTGLVLLPQGPLTWGPTGGFPSSADKLAFIDGALVFTGRPPAAYPDPRVTWAGGRGMKVRALGALSTFHNLLSTGSCPACMHPLHVTGARPVTATVATNKGQAEIPAWAFTIQGVATPVIQAALAPGSYATVPSRIGSPWAPPRALVGSAGARPLSGGRTLQVMVPASPCDTRWGALVYATASAVVVGGWTYDPNPDAPCAASLILRGATVRLGAPLAGRVILDAAAGVPVDPAPYA